jgi:hypothetical protein
VEDKNVNKPESIPLQLLIDGPSTFTGFKGLSLKTIFVK